MKKLIAGIAAVLIGSMASASTFYGESGEWLVLREDGEGTCTMIASYEGDSKVILTLNARENDVRVAFSDPTVKSLKNGDHRELDAMFTNGPGTGLDDGWAKKDYIVIVVNGERYFTRMMNAQFLDDMSRYKTMGFFYGDTLLQSYTLKGSAKAIALLRQCAIQEAKKNPVDPFADETRDAGDSI